jgi:hypothetical protein
VLVAVANTWLRRPQYYACTHYSLSLLWLYNDINYYKDEFVAKIDYYYYYYYYYEIFRKQR